MRAVHLSVVELEGDGECRLKPAFTVTAPGQKGIGEYAAVLVGYAIEFCASHCRRADYHGFIVEDILTRLANGQKLSPPLMLSAITLMAIRSYLYSFPSLGNM